MPVTPVVVLTAPLVGAMRFGEQAFAVHVGAVPANVPVAWHMRVPEALSV